MDLRLLCSCILLGLVYQQASARRPPYIECANSDECGTMECCVISMARFSVPTCRSFPDIGETCVPFNEQFINTSLTYPDGETVEFTNVYRISCPCGKGLTCGQDSTCYDPAMELDTNYIMDY